MIKLKQILALFFIIFLCGCPGEQEQICFKILSVKVNNVLKETGEIVEENSSIRWDSLAISLVFSTEELIATNKNRNNSNIVLAAPYTLPIAIPGINDFKIEYLSETNLFNVTQMFSVYMYKEQCHNTIECLNYIAALQFNRKDTGKEFLQLKQSPPFDLSDGYFLVQFDFEDGTILKDSTKNITIRP